MKNLPWLACKFDLEQSERKSSQVNASARKPWPKGVASRPKFLTCVYLRVRLARALYCYRLNDSALSPDQTDRQAVASGRKLNLRRDLRWVAKRTRKVSSQVHASPKNKTLQADCPLFHWLIIG